MIDHNIHHNDDLHKLLHAFMAVDKSGEAALLEEAMLLFKQGNDKLSEALKSLGGG
jgi:hypothetical protein